MQILTVDIGTGTQDIFLYDSELDIENGFKLVVPSPTMIIHRKINEATHRGQAILLTGVIMGGGPSQWAAEEHIRAGLPLYATPQAALSFNDDLAMVREMGIQIISDDEAKGLPNTVQHLELRDFDLNTIEHALGLFGVKLKELAAIAIAVFDHGHAPAGYSDRQFRFDYLDERIRTYNRLSAFAYLANDVPAILTRFKAVVESAGNLDSPLVVMDTAPAAILGAQFDQRVSTRQRNIIVNVGNFHTLAFRLGESDVEAVFEHHTGLLDLPKLEMFLLKLADGRMTHEEVFSDHGHGALVYINEPLQLVEEDQPFGVVVTGPRRNMMHKSVLKPHFAVPFGDMMITGCFGLLAAVADLIPELRDVIHASLRGEGGSGTPPWEIS